MRVTPPPTAHPIAAAAVPLAVALVPLAFPPPAAAVRWQRPVPGGVTRMFDYARGAPFVPGAHRGADFAARPGATVRAACDGTVAYAGPALGGGVVTLLCGARRVTHLPLARVTVRRGTRVRAGAPIGVLAAGHGGPEAGHGALAAGHGALAAGRGALAARHGGLHLGVRAAGDRFGYEDPLALLPPPASPRPLPPSSQRPLPPAPRASPPPSPRAAPVPAARPVSPRRAPPARAPAPPLAWAGLALVLLGAVGSGTVRGTRGRRAARVRAGAGAWRTG